MCSKKVQKQLEEKSDGIAFLKNNVVFIAAQK
jgi:hypothetical protein